MFVTLQSVDAKQFQTIIVSFSATYSSSLNTPILLWLWSSESCLYSFDLLSMTFAGLDTDTPDCPVLVRAPVIADAASTINSVIVVSLWEDPPAPALSNTELLGGGWSIIPSHQIPAENLLQLRWQSAVQTPASPWLCPWLQCRGLASPSVAQLTNFCPVACNHRERHGQLLSYPILSPLVITSHSLQPS